MIETSEKSGRQYNIDFVKAIAKYFMAFLETDFHKRKRAKRIIQSRNSNNLLIGLNTKKYKTFNDATWKTINSAFTKNSISEINKSQYKTNIPNNLLDIITLQLGKISNKEIKQIFNNIASQIEILCLEHRNNYDLAIETISNHSNQIIKENLVSSFIDKLKEPLKKLQAADSNNISEMEEELTLVIYSLIKNNISEIVKEMLVSEKNTKSNVESIAKKISTGITTENIKEEISTFFENFKVGDLFFEVYEMEQNKKILDKQEFYLYFCDITFDQNKFPIFYLPINLTKVDANSFKIEFDAQVYVNTKALNFIAQEYNEKNNVKKKIADKFSFDRIIYLADHENDFHLLISQIINEITNSFQLDGNLNLTDNQFQVAKNLFIKISNSCYLTLFDKSDEALVNDYEEIQELLNDDNNELAKIFCKLISDILYNEPKKEKIEKIVDKDWDDREIGDKLVIRSPISLNEEQLKITTALKDPECKYVAVQGPPGTGKSHTITAIVFNAILNNQSVLVLSDKKEALDVVEDKITSTLNQIRSNDQFQNPILRLGKTGNAYGKILNPDSMRNIKNNYLAVEKQHQQIEKEIERAENSLKEDIEAEVIAYEDISIEEIQIFEEKEFNFNQNYRQFIDESIINADNAATELYEIGESLAKIKKLLQKKVLSNLLNILGFNDDSLNSINSLNALSDISSDITKKMLATIRKFDENQLAALDLFSSFTTEQYQQIKDFLTIYEKEKKFIFGYAFNKKKIYEIDKQFKDNFAYIDKSNPSSQINRLNQCVEIFRYILSLDGDIYPDIDYVKCIHKILTNKDFSSLLGELVEIKVDCEFISSYRKKYNSLLNEYFADDSINTIVNLLNQSWLCDIDEKKFQEIIEYIDLKQKIQKSFNFIPINHYLNRKKEIEKLATIKMSHIIDDRVLNFYNNYYATAQALKRVIQKKKKFPKEEFLKLKDAFPCILAGIRDYAEFIPLEANLFDLVIIDEASQVSIAQALPALLRAKKVLILGDNKQFSNVKTSQAATIINNQYINDLKKYWTQNIKENEANKIRAEQFNIKTSVLDFFTYISNYTTTLLKHFRCYKEIISYSNEKFYGKSLEIMKIRGQSISDTLKFTILDHDGKKEVSANTNTLEAEFIIKELEKIKNNEQKISVGIITPHTNQAKKITDMIGKNPNKDYFYDNLKLKIMTFDSCQGEERDLIFYSMVATENDDRLWGVFIRNLSDINIEEDGKIKAQRLNVGFSRAKESIHFVLSKPIEKFSGSIGEALMYYENKLNNAKKEKNIDEVDKKSPMEEKVLHWFYQTNFWLNNKDNIEFFPQFKLGEQLKQLDSNYNHPKYEVDFLLLFKDSKKNDIKIIIEYDGFAEHFTNRDEVTEYNYEDYYNEDDVYRQKVLESYGYQFIRINRFNVGDNPIEKIDERIKSTVNNSYKSSNITQAIKDSVSSIENGEQRQCPKCKQLRNQKDFIDETLASRVGRFCKECKHVKHSHQSSKNIKTSYSKNQNCPKCGARMILRSGRYGKFYGCSKFPYCKGTRNI